MPWNSQSGGGNGDGQRGPWSREPHGAGGPPDLDELLRRGREWFKRLLPAGRVTPQTLWAVAAALVAGWVLSGVYFVSSHEQGFVMRFGRVVAHSTPGINYHLPWPIESPEVVEVGNENPLDIGYRQTSEVSDSSQAGDMPSESLMLTADDDIADIHFSVRWIVKDASAFIFNVENTDKKPEKTIRAVAESAMREAIGAIEYDNVNSSRAAIETRVRRIMQQTLDAYGFGVTVTGIKLVDASNPPQVSEAFHGLQAAQSDQAVKREDAEAYANSIIPEARGRAVQIVQQAEAYRQQAIAEASGEAKQFRAVYEEYRKAPDVTRRRMYIETMSQVLAPMNKVILDSQSAHGVVPWLQLPDPPRDRTETVTVEAKPLPGSASQTPQRVTGPQP